MPGPLQTTTARTFRRFFPLAKSTCLGPSSTPPSCLHLHQPPSGKDELPVLGTGLTPYERLDPGAAPSLFLDSLLFFSVSSEKSTCPLHVCWLACRISFASHVHDAAFNLVTPCYLCPLPCMVEKRSRDIVPHSLLFLNMCRCCWGSEDVVQVLVQSCGALHFLPTPTPPFPLAALLLLPPLPLPLLLPRFFLLAHWRKKGRHNIALHNFRNFA